MARSGSLRGLWWLLGVIVVLAGLAVAADRITLAVAESTAADSIKTSQHLPNKPDVDVDGFPFLTQLASGTFDEVTVTAKGVPVAQTGNVLDLSVVTVVLHHVHESNNFNTVHTDTARATATVSYADLGTALGIKAHYAGGGRVAASVSVLGQQVTASAQPVLRDNTIVFASPTAQGGGVAGSVASAALDKVFAPTVPLKDIPFGLQAQSLTVGNSGLTLTLVGSNITYTDNGTA